MTPCPVPGSKRGAVSLPAPHPPPFLDNAVGAVGIGLVSI